MAQPWNDNYSSNEKNATFATVGVMYQHFHRRLEATSVQNELKHGGTLSRR